MTAEIHIHNLSKKYLKGPEALHKVSLTIPAGSFFTLLGPNGAGKSTLVKILTTLIDRDSGDFLIGGMDPSTKTGEILKYIGVASQENELDPNETAEGLLVFQGRLFGLSLAGARRRAEELVEILHLKTERNKKTGVLSGGNKRRLHCALALVHKPRVLFLDEPTVGMDPLARSTFWEVINNLNKTDEVTVFLTTQYLEEADKHATEMALLIEGRIHYTGPVAGFKRIVHPLESRSLDDSYLAYINSLSENENILN